MAPIFISIVHENNKVVTLHVNQVLGNYYPILADGESTLLGLIKGKYAGMNGRFFVFLDGEWKMLKLEQLDCMPDFLLSFDVGTVVQDKDWDVIYEWVCTIFRGEDDYELNQKVEELVPKPGPAEPVVVAERTIEPPPQSDSYSFRYFIDEGRDYGLFEICKPFTDRPFTAVVRKYKERGFLPLFTAYYVSSAWGVTNYDHLFLLKIWDHLGMKETHGVLDLEQRLKEDIAKCLPDNPGGPESEPEVYRLSIDQLIDQWSNKRANEEFVEADRKKIKTLF